MIYFNGCRTMDEIKAQYKKLAKENHPDHGGDTATMQAINTEYAFACAHAIKGENLSAEETEAKIKFSELYREAIEKISNLPGIMIEAVGFWIWVTGNTYPVRKELKAANFFFASKKLAWYFRSDEYKTKGGKKSLEEIRRKYGSEKINSKEQFKILEQD
jgi:hypothetical protein